MENYTKIKKLGSGSFGNIFLVSHKETNQNYVLKSIDLKSLTKTQRKDALKEINILSQFKSSYIIKYKEFFYSNQSIDILPFSHNNNKHNNNEINNSKPLTFKNGTLSLDNSDLQYGHILYIIMEYADGGDLDTLIKNNLKVKKLFTEDKVLTLFTQICLSIRDIHNKHIIHRDIKSENIFLMKNNQTIKMGDFGIRFVIYNLSLFIYCLFSFSFLILHIFNKYIYNFY